MKDFLALVFVNEIINASNLVSKFGVLMHT